MAISIKIVNDYVDEEFEPQNNGEISESITQNWTEQALECYQLGCDCSRCSISKGKYSFVCQMPKVVKILLKMGKPTTSINLAQA
ncbi:hypothetical protein IJ707_05095 [bacterium]|nr:hypothetical protein [bacterium]